MRMNDFRVHVRGCQDGRNADRISPVFVWNAPPECRQFTIEMSRDSEFEDIVFLRDTRERYCVYNSVELQAGRRYYVRVRSGIGPWSSAEFVTEQG